MDTWFIAVLLMAIVSVTPLGGPASLRRNRFRKMPASSDGLELVRVKVVPVEAHRSRWP